MSSSFIPAHRLRFTGGSNHASSSHAPAPGIHGIDVARWIFEQQLEVENANEMENLNTTNTSRHLSPVIIVSDDEDDSRGNNQPRGASIAPPLRSVQTSGTGIKRKNHDADMTSTITVRRPLPSSVVGLRGTMSQTRQQHREVIDLTLSDDDSNSPPRAPKRHRNNRWQDKNIPEANDARDEFRIKIHSLLGEAAPLRVRPARPSPPPPVSEVEMDIDEAKELIVETAPEPVELKDYFFSLPREIRNKIYRLLLVSPKPIPVKDLWQEVIVRKSTRRTRGAAASSTTRTCGRVRVPAMGEEPELDFSLDPRILRVSKRACQEGAAVLYGENTFHYLLRDPGAANALSSTSGKCKSNASRSNRRGNNRINLQKYGGLIRHVGIELDSNRTGPEYERLMTAALRKFVRTDYEGMGIGYPRDAVVKEVYGPMDVPFHLRTLTITVSPLFEQVSRAVVVGGDGGGGDGNGNGQAQGGDSVVVREPRTLSVVRFFCKNSGVSKALREINVDFLRVNVHVNSHLAGNKNRKGDDDENNEGDGDGGGGEQQQEEQEQVDQEGIPLPKPKQWHLEMTLDLRWVQKHMEKLRREEPLGDFWENDAIVKAARVKKGQDAVRTLVRLRKLLEDACKMPEYVLKRGRADGLWQTAESAEMKRLEEKKRREQELEPDGYDNLDPCRPDVIELRRKLRRRRHDSDDEDEIGSEDGGSDGESDEEEDSDSEEESDSDEDESDDDAEEIEAEKLPLSRRLKSLVISIDKVGNEWKCFRI